MFKFFKEKLKDFFSSEKKPEEKQEKAEKKAKKIVEKAKKEKSKYKETEKVSHKEEKKQELKAEITEVIEEAKEEIEKASEEKVSKKENITETKKPEEKQGFFAKLAKLPARFNTVSIDQKTFNEFFEKLEMLLLENNVALEVVDKIREDMQKRLVNIEVKKDQLEIEIKNTLRDSILDILIEPFDLVEKIKKKSGVFIILFFGINGSGKTTTIAKIANMLQKNKLSSVLAAGDTFRAASIEQLEKHGEKLGIKVIHQSYGADPSAVAFDAIKYAEAHQIKTVLIDTAGRMHTKDNLLKEMEKIIRVTKPDLKIFVAESITGNDATEQAKIFNETANIDGTILTKADVDEKGGTAISIGYITKKPILFLGTGQTYDAIEKFNPKEIIVNLGLG